MSAFRWRRRAERLADAVNRHCWDERDGTFYSADLALRPIDRDDWLHSGAPRACSSLLLPIDNEFRHPDNGEPIMTRNFQNWNFLALTSIAYLEGRTMVAEF